VARLVFTPYRRRSLTNCSPAASMSPTKDLCFHAYTRRSLRQEAAFQPPQSFRYVAATDPSQLRGLIPALDPAVGDPREIARPGTVRKPTTSSGTSSASVPAKTSLRGTSRDRPIWIVADS
jgi:hypothetical protein